RIIIDEYESWVLFKYGTCVILKEPEGDPAEKATSILKEWGPVQAGCSAGDFWLMRHPEYGGWVVFCHHPDILSYVSPDELTELEPPHARIGLLGRSKRDRDAREPEIIHVEYRHKS